jgi:hypothetical protein
VACRLKMMTCEIIKMMVQMIGSRLLILKIPFFGLTMWQNPPELYRLKYASPFLRAPACFKRYNPLACRVTSR